MSVLVMLRMKADADHLEEYAQTHADLMRRVAAAGRAAGAISHGFAGADGEVMVIDEWPDEAAFRAFFDNQPEIADIMAGAGVQGPPEVSFLRRLDTPDTF